MTDPATSVKLVVAGIGMLQRTAPTGLAYVRKWWKGKRILILGDRRAGKSSFLDYFQYGIFEEERETDKTFDPEDRPTFTITVGKAATLELNVRKSTEIPGQWGPEEQAKEAFDRNPHAIVILVDLKAPLTMEDERGSADWLSEFCIALEKRWRASRKRNNLQALIILLNKADKVTNEDIENSKKRFKEIVRSELKSALGTMFKNIQIMPCILVQRNLS